MPRITIDITDDQLSFFRTHANRHGVHVKDLVKQTLENAVDGCVRESNENSMRDAMWLAARQVPERSK